MVEVDGVCREDVVAIYRSGVDVLVDFAGVERGVVNVADCEGNGICGRWQEAAGPVHKVLSEGHLCVVTEVEALASASAAWVRPPRLPREFGASV